MQTSSIALPSAQGTSELHRLHQSRISVDTHSYLLHSLACLTQIAVESLAGGSSCSTARHHRCIMHHGPESVSGEPFTLVASVGHSRIGPKCQETPLL